MRWNSGDGVTLDVRAPSLPLLADTGDDVNENSIVVIQQPALSPPFTRRLQ